MTTLLINPGSGAVADSGDGWTNTYAVARQTAEDWLVRMQGQGIRDVGLADSCGEFEGRWTFFFTHQVTGVIATLETHGVDNLAAYRKELVFDPRVYWCGSSSADPQLSDWEAVGFEPVCTYRAVAGDLPESGHVS